MANRWIAASVLGWIASLTCVTAAEPPGELLRWLKPQDWQRDVDGPILSLGAAGEFDDRHIFAPAVIEENGRFQLWYSGSRGRPGQRVFRLGLATSRDGKQFEKYPQNPVLELADGARSVLTPALLRQADGSVLREEGNLRMWFSAATLGRGGLHTLHETTSSDGIHWSEPTEAQLENVYCPTILRTARGYEMWYSDVSRRPWVIRHASSADGRQWSVTPRPALQLSQEWEAEVLVYPAVLQVGEAYLMWYGSYDSATRRQTTAIGFAASLDGLVWHKHPRNPVFRPDPDRSWESNYVGSGSVLRLSDGSFRYWYASRKQPPFENLYFAINTARWAGPAEQFAAATPAEDAASEAVLRYLRRCDEGKEAAIKKLAAEIRATQQRLEFSPEAQDRLKLVEASLKQIQEQPAPLLPLVLPPQKGEVGTLTPADRRHSIVVQEVVDERNAIVRVWHATAADAADAGTSAEETFADLWMEGIDTRGLSAQTAATFHEVFQVTGSRLFDTTCGKRSLPLLIPVEVERFRGD